MSVLSEFLCSKFDLSEEQQHDVDAMRTSSHQKIPVRIHAHAIECLAHRGNGSADDVLTAAKQLVAVDSVIELFECCVRVWRKQASLDAIEDAKLTRVARAARVSLAEPDTFSALLREFQEAVPRVVTPDPDVDSTISSAM